MKADDWAEIPELLHRHPAGARVKDRSGDIPLHLALKKKAPLEVIVTLLAKYPVGAELEDSNGINALHLALLANAPLQVIQALLKTYPAGAEGKTNSSVARTGCLALRVNASECSGLDLKSFASGLIDLEALHLAAALNSSLAVINTLLETYPAAAEAISSSSDLFGYRWLPLHYALKASSNERVLQRLIAAYPAGVTQTVGISDCHDGLTLHLAIKYNATIRIIEQLLKMYPDAVNAQLTSSSWGWGYFGYYFARVHVVCFLALLTCMPISCCCFGPLR